LGPKNLQTHIDTSAWAGTYENYGAPFHFQLTIPLCGFNKDAALTATNEKWATVKKTLVLDFAEGLQGFTKDEIFREGQMIYDLANHGKMIIKGDLSKKPPSSTQWRDIF
jgi:hypothetical protein